MRDSSTDKAPGRATIGGLLAALMASGCLELGGSEAGMGATASGPSANPDDAPEPAPTETTGALAVLVTDLEQQPVAAATVTLEKTEHRQRTDAGGRATFNGLVPGAYTVVAAKPGHRTLQERGRIVEIRVLEITEARLTLSKLELVTQDTSYFWVAPMKGFLACGVEARASGSLAAQSFPCGRGVNYGGQNYLRDPNDNTSHPWQVENVQVQGWWLEARWQASQPLAGSMLSFRTANKITCNGTNCNYEKYFGERTSASPARFLIDEGPNKNISRLLGTDPSRYPWSLTTDVRVHCPTGSCVVAAMVSQRYDAFVTVFYGQDPPKDYSVFQT